MKKNLLFAFTAIATLTLAGCSIGGSKTSTSTSTSTSETTSTSTSSQTSSSVNSDTESSSSAAEVTVMTYKQFSEAAVDDKVTVETYVQAAQSWWTDSSTGVSQASFYCQSEDGGYFVYNMACSEEEYAKLTVPGTKVRLTGTKASWSGEVEITDAKFEILTGDTYIAEATDITKNYEAASTDYINQKVAVYSAKVVASKNKAGEEKAFLYKYDGSGSQGDDLYFTIQLGSKTYTVTVESYLCGKDTDTYKTVESLSIGDVVDFEAFLYQYEGNQPHVYQIKKSNKSAGTTTHKQFVDAEIDEIVNVETYVQAAQSWWTDSSTGKSQASFYTEDEDGGYFIYNLECTEEEYAKLTVPGTKIKVTGKKGYWSGEDEITDATFTILTDDTYVAAAKDVTALYNTDMITDYANTFVSIKNVTIVGQKNSNDEVVPYLYKYNGSGSDGDDLYFRVSVCGVIYTFTVESYLCDKDSETYNAVKALNVGDVINVEAFLYQYNGNQPHVTKVTKTGTNTKDEGVIGYADYVLAEADKGVVIEAYVQDKQSWWDNKATLYLADADGGYFAYNTTCSQETYDQLTVGTKVKISGVKSVWAEEQEIGEGGTIEIISGDTFTYDKIDVTELFGTEDLYSFNNSYVEVKGAKVVASKDGDGNEAAYLYKWNGSGSEGDDLYFNVEINGEVYSFTVESYLRGADTDVYKAVKALQIGDTIDIDGFLYWYNAPQTHVTNVTKK